MRPSRLLWLLALSCLFFTAGCNYVHFGRLEKLPSDATLANDNLNLRIEKKLLLEELAIAHKEGDALRAALDHPVATTGPASAELVAKLNETTRELATLRAGYARLQSERERLQSGTTAPADGTAAKLAAAEQIADLKTRMGETEEKLAESLRNYTRLQEDNNRLRVALDEAHSENATLATKVDQISAQNQEARSALAQLNTEFLAQKEARAQAEQAADALRAQLRAITDQPRVPAGPAPSLASARESSASGAREIDATLQLAQPAADTAAPPTATLSTNPQKLRAAAEKSAPPPPVAPLTLKPTRTYVVGAGDTLEKIAEKFYGRRDRWSLLYAANNAQLSGGRPLKPGMQLEIPEE